MFPGFVLRLLQAKNGLDNGFTLAVRIFIICRFSLIGTLPRTLSQVFGGRESRRFQTQLPTNFGTSPWRARSLHNDLQRRTIVKAGRVRARNSESVITNATRHDSKPAPPTKSTDITSLIIPPVCRRCAFMSVIVQETRVMQQRKRSFFGNCDCYRAPKESAFQTVSYFVRGGVKRSDFRRDKRGGTEPPSGQQLLAELQPEKTRSLTPKGKLHGAPALERGSAARHPRLKA